ncbi:MAG: tetratricopeptide repeat protein [Bacteroidales bacterium]|nr:tetratricopeptide repeat protein [Bacteroidales bacterium]
MKKQKKQIKKETLKKTKTGWFYLAGILVLTVIVYSNSINNNFIYQFDDDLYITNNPDIKSLTTESIGKVFTNSYVGLYLPMTMLSYMVEYSLFELNPAPYHVTNLILHLACIILAFFLIYKIKPNIYIASVVAFVFALHPLHVESVSWISERKDVLYAVFYLAGLITYLNFTIKRSLKNYFLTLLLFILSLLSKTVAVSFPLILLAFDWYKGRKLLSKAVILEKIPFFALSLVFGLLAIHFTSIANDTSTPDIAWIHRPFIVSSAILIYLYKFIAPFNLMNYYYYPDTSSGTLPTDFYVSTVILLLVVAGVIWWVAKSKNNRKDIILGLAFFAIPTFFILQIIPAGRAFAAERYTYLSYIGLAYIFGIATVNFLQDKSKNNIPLRSTLIGIIAFFAIGFSYFTWDRNKDWKDTFTLFNDLIAKNPEHGHPYLVRGITHVQFGNRQQALADYNTSIGFDPDNPKTLANRASVKGMLGDYNGALQDANRALEIDPKYENALSNRATAHLFREEFDEALADYDKLLAFDSTKVEVIKKRITVFEKMNQNDKALNDYLKLTRLEPSNYLNFAKAGEIYYHLDQNTEAIAYISQSLQMKPTFYQPLFIRGNAYFKIGEYQKSLNDFSPYADNSNDPNAFYNMGMCFKMLNRVDEACKAWEKALSLGHQDAVKRIAESCK